jgi:hypothetical protein
MVTQHGVLHAGLVPAALSQDIPRCEFTAAPHRERVPCMS